MTYRNACKAPLPGRMAAALFRPKTWPRWVRRIFLLTIPVAAPTWAGLVFLMIGLAVAQGVWRPIRDFWSAPRQYHYRYGHFGYHPYSRGRAKPAGAESRGLLAIREETFIPAE